MGVAYSGRSKAIAAAKRCSCIFTFGSEPMGRAGLGNGWMRLADVKRPLCLGGDEPPNWDVTVLDLALIGQDS